MGRGKWRLYGGFTALSIVCAGCGGGGSDAATSPVTAPAVDTTLVDATTPSFGGSDTSQQTSWDTTLDGPPFKLSSAGNVQVCVSGRWTQQSRGGGSSYLTYTPLAPVALPARQGVGVDAYGPGITSFQVRIDTCDTLALPAGTHALRSQVHVDCGCLMGSYSGVLRFVVRRVD